MLDGQVLGASQVEYKPFGKLPLKRELAFPAAPPALHRSLHHLPGRECRDSLEKPCIELPARFATKLRATCPALKPRQAAEHPVLAICAICAYLTLYLTRQAAEHPLFPGSLLYVLYVLYTLYALQNAVYVLYKAYLVHVEMLCVSYTGFYTI